jgi:dehydrogenase/reductase SDR family protein 7B
MNDFSGKTVIITGASSGIGKACAMEFAKRGANVVLAARNADSLEKVAAQLADVSKVISVVCDVSREEDCKNLIDTAVNNFGKINVLINNAGISMRALFEEVDMNVLKQVMEINFWGTVYCSKYALPHLIASKGSLVGISSTAGKVGLPGRTAYSASKFAMEGLLQSIRTENLHNSLHVLVACPGFTASDIRNKALSKDGSIQGESPRDESKMMQPQEVAEKIASAVLKRKRDLILTSEGKLTVLLSKFFPAWLDKMIFNHMAKEPNSPFKK